MLIGHQQAEHSMRELMENGTLSHGWIISGPQGIGKATFAARLAKAKLAPEALTDTLSLATDPAHPIVRQISSMAHPDLFVARRRYDEKKQKLDNDISVDRIRTLTRALTLTASGDHGRVAIIDAADDMNRNAANALLKILEEPPEKTLIILISHAPGRLLATLRSRCRKIALRSVPDDPIRQLLTVEVSCTRGEADKIVEAAGGRPGYALSLAQNDGASALAAAESFVANAMGNKSIGPVAEQFSKKNTDAQWQIFRDHMMVVLSREARRSAIDPASGLYSPDIWVKSWEAINALCDRGERLNLDRNALISAIGYDLAQIAKG